MSSWGQLLRRARRLAPAAVLGLLAILPGSAAAEDAASLPRERLLVLAPDGRPAARVLLSRTRERVEGLPVLEGGAPGEVKDLVRGLMDPLPEPRRGDEVLVLWSEEAAAVPAPTGAAGATVGIRLASAARLEGRILFARGAAAGDLVVLGVPASGRGVVHRTRTAKDGSWQLAHLAPGRWRVAVRRGDGRLQPLGVYAAGESVGEMAIDAGARIRGLVLDGEASERTPRPGMRLRLLPLPREAGDVEGAPIEVTDENGIFEVADLVPGVYEARPAEDGLYFAPAPPRFDARPRRNVELRPFFAMRYGEIVGRIADVEERPLEGASVRLLPDATDEPPPEGWPPMPAAKTDADGAFRLPGVRPVQRYRLVVSHAGHASALTRPFDVGRAPSYRHPPIGLERGWRLEVRLRRPGGAPVADARVRVVPASRPVASDDPAWDMLVREGRSDVTGRVVLRDLPADDARVVAGGDAWLEVEGVVPYPRTGDVRTWTGTLFPAPSLAGRLVGEDAERLPALRVVAIPRDGSGRRDVEVGEGGRFRVEGLPATPTDIEVSLLRRPEGPPLARYEGALPGEGREIRILVPHLRRIAGRAIGLKREGGPAFALLEAPLLEDGEDHYAWRTVRKIALAPAPLGVPFAFEDLAPGAYAARVVQGRVDSGAVNVRVVEGDVTELEIVLPGAGRIAGTVLDDRDMPVLGAIVRLVRIRGDGDAPGGPGRGIRTATDADGTFVIDDVAPGLWRVEVRERRLATDHVVVRVGEGETVITRDMLVGRGGVLTGTVTDASGRPLDGARLRLESLHDGVEDRDVLSSEDGSFRVGELEPGPWRVTLRSRAGAFTDLELLVTIVKGEQTEIDLRAEGRAEIRGTVRRRGAPVGDVTLHLVRRPQGEGEQARRLKARTDATGRFLWDGLDPGRYEVGVVDGVVRSTRRIEVVDGDRLDLDLEVWDGRLPGRVVTRAGRGVASATVVARPVGAPAEGAILARVRTDPSGGFVLAGLPVGLYDLEVDPVGLPPGRRKGVRAETEDAAPSVTIVLGAGGTIDLDVVDPGGRGVIGARVWIEDADGLAFHTRPFTTSGSGRLRLTGVPTGEQWLRVYAPRLGRPGRRRVVVREGETTQSRIQLGPPGSIRLVVVGEDRNPVTRVRVDLVHAGTNDAVEVRRTLWPVRLEPIWGVLPRTGYRVFEDLGAGPYVIRLDAGSAYQAVEVPVAVTAGEERLVTVTMPFVEER